MRLDQGPIAAASMLPGMSKLQAAERCGALHDIRLFPEQHCFCLVLHRGMGRHSTIGRRKLAIPAG